MGYKARYRLPQKSACGRQADDPNQLTLRDSYQVRQILDRQAFVKRDARQNVEFCKPGNAGKNFNLNSVGWKRRDSKGGVRVIILKKGAKIND